MTGAKDKDGDADEVEHHRWHVQHVIRPVTPAGKKAVEVAEHFFCPQINAAFTGVTMREFDHRDPLRPEKQEQRDQPQPDGYASVGRDAGYDIEIEYGNHKQQHQVEASEDTLQMRLVVIGIG